MMLLLELLATCSLDARLANTWLLPSPQRVLMVLPPELLVACSLDARIASVDLFWFCPSLGVFAGISLRARLASTSLPHSPSELAYVCFLSWFLCHLSCALVFYSFMPNSCTITHKLKVPRSFHIVLQINKSKGGFEHFFDKKE